MGKDNKSVWPWTLFLPYELVEVIQENHLQKFAQHIWPNEKS